MKKHLPILTLLVLFPFFLFSKKIESKNNSLASSAGTMDLSAQFYCDGESAFPLHNNDASLDAGDILKFVIHDNSGMTLGNMFGGQGDVTTAYAIFPGMTAGVTYYISAIAGADDGTGKVDLNDPELSVAQGTPVVFADDFEVSIVGILHYCGGDGTTLTATITGGVAPYSYLWSDSNTTQNLTIPSFSSGIYTVTVTDAMGCTAIDEVETEVFPNPVPNILGGLTIDCNNPTSVLTAGAGWSAYEWSTGDLSQIISVFSVGTYTVTIVDGNGCTGSASIVVTEDLTEPVVSVIPPQFINCNVTSVILDGSASNGSGALTYLWSTGETTPVINAVSAGLYTLTVTGDANGCTSFSTIAVIEDVNTPIANASVSGLLDCITGVVTLDGSGSSVGNNIIYQWQSLDGNIVSGQNTLNPIVDQVGIYQLIVINTFNGCSSTSTTEVIGTGALGFDLGSDTYFDCNNSEMVLTGNNIPIGADYTYTWTTMDGTIVSSANTPSVTISAPGTYALQVDDTVNGCVGTHEVVVYDMDEILVVNPNVELNCTGQISIDLAADILISNSNMTYEWTTADGVISFGENSLHPFVSAVGTYVLVATDAVTGCSSSATVQVNDPVSPTASIDVTGSLVLTCDNPSVVLNVDNPVANWLYIWQKDGITFSTGNSGVTPTSSGVYSLIVTNNGGCKDTAQVEVTEDITVVSFNLPVLELNCGNNFTVETGPVFDSPLTSDVTYSWSDFNGNSISSDSSIIVNMEGVYELIVTNTSNGCTSSLFSEAIINGFDVNVSATTADCDQENGTATATTTATNSLIEWSNGEEGNTITNLAQGWYSVTVSDLDNNCNQHQNFFVDEDISCKVVISGYVLIDQDSTCTYDSNFEGVACAMIKLEPLGIYTMTDTAGYYEFVVDDGTYTVEYIGSAEVDLYCPLPGSYEVTLATNGSVSDDNYFFTSRPEFDLCITKYTGNARPGFLQFNCLQVCNWGENTEDAVVTFVHDSIFSEVLPLPNIFPINALSQTYTYDETTHTFTWNVTLEAGECRKIMWNMEVPQTVIIGDIISTTAKVNPIANDLNPENNCLAWSQFITGSYDPNDKRNFVGETALGGAIYEEDMTMEYAIRFQNVGNDTAFTVVVRDTLDDEHLDVTSIRGFTSSHDMQVQFEDRNVLIFTFENIMLVDSTTNEAGSNGWLSFDIDRKPDLDFGAEINNQAAIYFDYNSPVITNEVVNVLTEETVSVFSPIKNTLQIQVTPTVTNVNVLLQYVLENPSRVSVEIYNVDGVLLQGFDFGKKQIGEHQKVLDLQALSAGVYFIFIKTEKESGVKRVVKVN